MSRQNLASTAVVDLEDNEAKKEDREERHEARAKAAGKVNVDPARLGAELSAEDRPRDEGETAEALKRATKDGAS